VYEKGALQPAITIAKVSVDELPCCALLAEYLPGPAMCAAELVGPGGALAGGGPCKSLANGGPPAGGTGRAAAGGACPHPTQDVGSAGLLFAL